MSDSEIVQPTNGSHPRYAATLRKNGEVDIDKPFESIVLYGINEEADDKLSIDTRIMVANFSGARMELLLLAFGETLFALSDSRDILVPAIATIMQGYVEAAEKASPSTENKSNLIVLPGVH